VNNILGSCSSTIALRTLRFRGMPCQVLFEVTRASTLARMMYGVYASPAWWFLLNESDLNRLESFIHRARRVGFHPDLVPTFNNMAALVDSTPFGAIISNHGLRSLSRERPAIICNLSPRSRPLILSFQIVTVGIFYLALCARTFISAVY